MSFYVEIIASALLATLFTVFLFPVLLFAVVWFFSFLLFLLAIDCISEKVGGSRWRFW